MGNLIWRAHYRHGTKRILNRLGQANRFLIFTPKASLFGLFVTLGMKEVMNGGATDRC